MSKFHARQCPKCKYFIGFAIAAPAVKSDQLPLISFCLNCNYKLPVYGIIAGKRRAARSLHRAGLRLVCNPPGTASCLGAESESCKDMGTKITPADYARHLRAIGQDLEARQLRQFNLEFCGDAYLVWVQASPEAESTQPLFRISRKRLERLWRNRTPYRAIGHEESYPTSPATIGKRLRYSVQELDRIEKEQRARRRPQSGNANGHCLSQLLRTLGDLVGRRSERLLGIAWHELSIGVVFETPQGRKEMELFRPDNLYDLWVKMYLKRDHRAFFDTPH